jgi:Cu+-exporting ATPase
MATLIKDPVCGMMVDPGTSRTETYGGKVYGFCSESCRQKFHADPTSYVIRRKKEPDTSGKSPGT